MATIKTARAIEQLHHLAAATAASLYRPHYSLENRSSPQSIMATTKSFIDSVNERRSYYLLNDQSPISDDRIVELVNQAIRNVPSSFNSQSTRVVLLLKDEHNKLWEYVVCRSGHHIISDFDDSITKEILKTLIPEAAYAATAQKLDGFKAGYGTVSIALSAIANDSEAS
jgi:hypothetical protein